MDSIQTQERRRSRRLPIPTISVEIHALDLPEQAGWMASAIDINGDGMALVLPSELPAGTPLLLSFDTDDQTSFDLVPCVVKRQDNGYGAVTFDNWTRVDILSLLGFLANRVELN